MEVKEIVREKYGEAARRVSTGAGNNCCGAAAALDGCCDPITSNLYDASQYRSKLAAAGFDSIDIEPTRVYDIEDARAFLSGEGIDVDPIAPQVEGKFMSAFIRAAKPALCCGSFCCS